MRIAVIGAGLAGITTAYELNLAGHEVTVYEQRASTAAEGSFAGNGLRGFGFSLLSHSASASGSLSILASRPSHFSALGVATGPTHWRWMAQRWAWHRRIDWSAQDDALQSLHARGEERVLELQSRLQWDIHSSRGLLLLLAKTADERRMQPLLERLKRLGVSCDRWTSTQVRASELGLNPAAAMHGALRLPADSTSNGRLYTQLLRQEVERLGVSFSFNTLVRSIAPGSQPEVTVQAMAENGEVPSTRALRRERHDAVVLCAAMGARNLIEPLGLRLPLIGLRSVSVTAPLRLGDAEIDAAPSCGVIDVSRMVSITRLGREVRATRLPFVGSGSAAQTQRAVSQLFGAIDSWFPSAATVRQARPWSGAIATLPDGWPAVGPSGIDGVWLNVGHGQGGWSLACGHAVLLADMLGSRADVAQAAAVAPGRWAGKAQRGG